MRMIAGVDIDARVQSGSQPATKAPEPAPHRTRRDTCQVWTRDFSLPVRTPRVEPKPADPAEFWGDVCWTRRGTQRHEEAPASAESVQPACPTRGSSFWRPGDRLLYGASVEVIPPPLTGACPCGEPNGGPPCTFEDRCGYAKDPDAWGKPFTRDRWLTREAKTPPVMSEERLKAHGCMCEWWGRGCIAHFHPDCPVLLRHIPPRGGFRIHHWTPEPLRARRSVTAVARRCNDFWSKRTETP